MILIGNMATFENAKSAKGKSLWASIFTELKDQKALFDGFPTVCTNHQTAALLSTEKDFTVKIGPDGGCLEPCLQILPCLHKCPRSCHPYGNHATWNCEVKVEHTCEVGHKSNVACYSLKTRVVCSTCVRIKEDAERIARAEAKKISDELATGMEKMRITALLNESMKDEKWGA